MDLTRPYILWRLGTLDRKAIIAIADAEVQRQAAPEAAVIDLALSEACDDYEFAKRLAPFTDVLKITPELAIPCVAEAVRQHSAATAAALLPGLSWLMSELELGDPGHPVGKLYYMLDHYYTEAIPDGYGTLAQLQAFMDEWSARLPSPPLLEDRFRGCLMGLAMGDALCAGREGGPIERGLWCLIGRSRGRRRYTDDTQMSLDLARHLADHADIEPDSLALAFASSYRWSRGYGPSTADVLKRIRRGVPWRTAVRARFPEGSFGNGAAMRAPVVALAFCNQPDRLDDAVDAASAVTHPHPEAILGARLVCRTVWEALRGRRGAGLVRGLAPFWTGSPYAASMRKVEALLASGGRPSQTEVSRHLGLETSAVRSCPAAIFLGLHFLDRPLVDIIAFVNTCSGDTDTVAAMAGAIWGAGNGLGRIPLNEMRLVEDDAGILAAASALHGRAVGGGPNT